MRYQLKNRIYQPASLCFFVPHIQKGRANFLREVKMAIIRINKNTDFTVMSNFHFRDKNLSLKGKGLLSQMLSLPENWDFTIAGLVAINKENESAIKNTLKELRETGYLIVKKVMPDKTKSGRFEYIYDIYEQPLKKQGVEKQEVENQPLEFLQVENQGQYNTNNKILNNKILNNKEKYKKEFSELWQMYPNKKDKERAMSCYIKFRDNGTTFEEVKQGIENYNAYINQNNIDIKFIKNGGTWFYRKCWQDEYKLEEKSSFAGYDLELYEKMLEES